MASDLVLNSESVEATQPTPEAIAEALNAIPDEVQSSETAPAPTATPAPSDLLQPWAAVDVGWLVPLAGKLVQLPYEQAAKVTHDDCWLVTDEQLGLINPALENAIKWTVWRLGAANTISHPLVALGVAMGSLTAVKYGIYKVNELQRKEGGPPKRVNPPQPRQSSPHSITPDLSTENGRTAEPAGESSSAVNPEAVKAGSSAKEYVVLGE